MFDAQLTSLLVVVRLRSSEALMFVSAYRLQADMRPGMKLELARSPVRDLREQAKSIQLMLDHIRAGHHSGICAFCEIETCEKQRNL